MDPPGIRSSEHPSSGGGRQRATWELRVPASMSRSDKEGGVELPVLHLEQCHDPFESSPIPIPQRSSSV